jgi:phosphatidylethanolamine-binding protein (PEBP) family uncharacterized protein
VFNEDRRYSGACVSAPENVSLRARGRKVSDRVHYFVSVVSDEDVPPVFDRFNPLRLATQRDARHFEDVRFLLNAT